MQRCVKALADSTIKGLGLSVHGIINGERFKRLGAHMPSVDMIWKDLAVTLVVAVELLSSSQ